MKRALLVIALVAGTACIAEPPDAEVDGLAQKATLATRTLVSTWTTSVQPSPFCNGLPGYFENENECRDGVLYRCTEFYCYRNQPPIWRACQNTGLPCGDDYYTLDQKIESFPARYPDPKLWRAITTYK